MMPLLTVALISCTETLEGRFPSDQYVMTADDAPSWLTAEDGDPLFSLKMTQGPVLPGDILEISIAREPEIWAPLPHALPELAPGGESAFVEADGTYDSALEGLDLPIRVSVVDRDATPPLSHIVWEGTWTPKPLAEPVRAILETHRDGFLTCDAFRDQGLAAMAARKFDTSQKLHTQMLECLKAWKTTWEPELKAANLPTDPKLIDPVVRAWQREGKHP